MRRKLQYAAVTRDAAQRSPSTLLRAMSLSNGSWTFYFAIKVNSTANHFKLAGGESFRDLSPLVWRSSDVSRQPLWTTNRDFGSIFLRIPADSKGRLFVSEGD
jgi:hypothetical protein